MKNLIKKSFKRELIACFIIVAMLPLLLSSCFLIQILQNTVARDYERRAMTQIQNVDLKMVTVFSQFRNIADNISSNDYITQGITETDTWIKNRTYTKLYEEANPISEYGQVDIYDIEGMCRYSTGITELGSRMPTYWGVLKVATAHNGELIFRNASKYDTKNDFLLQAAQAIRDQNDELLGYVVIGMTEDHFENVLYNTYEVQNSIAILDNFWEEVYSTRAAKEEKIADTIRFRRMTNAPIRQSMDDIDFYIQPISETGLYVVFGRTPIFTSDITAIMVSVILMVALISLLLCIVLAEVLSNNLSSPIKRLSHAMARVEEGDLEQHIDTERVDELGQLSHSFNTMTKELKENVEMQVQHQKELNDVNISMMQAQLNPHFLYNTLDTIKWVAKANSIPELATLASSLAKILRTSISENKFITLENELKLVEYYTDIQQIRFHGNFSFDMEVPMELEDCMVPKLIIQPIVENAIIHGLEGREDGLVFLNAFQKDKNLCIEVTDDGCGMDQSIIELLNSRDRDKLKGHLGFYNVDTIIRLYYGDAYGLQAECLKEGGTKITITLPLQNGDR